MSNTIYRKEMLDILDVRKTPSGRPVIHAIKFVDNEGRLRFLPQCYVCGAGRMNNKLYRVRGFQPCDCSANPEGHIYPVNIYRIVWFNKKEVIG